MSTVIERARVDDATAIAYVQASSLGASHRDLIPDKAASLVLDTTDVEWRGRMWKKWLERSQVSTVVARVDGETTGFCTLQPVPGEAAGGKVGEISAFFVLPSHWRLGLGRLLFEDMLAETRTRGLSEVVLWVLESNERARCFYSSLGFRPDGEKRVFLEHSGDSLHELRYRRSTCSQARA